MDGALVTLLPLMQSKKGLVYMFCVWGEKWIKINLRQALQYSGLNYELK